MNHVIVMKVAIDKVNVTEIDVYITNQNLYDRLRSSLKSFIKCPKLKIKEMSVIE